MEPFLLLCLPLEGLLLLDLTRVVTFGLSVLLAAVVAFFGSVPVALAIKDAVVLSFFLEDASVLAALRLPIPKVSRCRVKRGAISR